jgi:hypothetical protein
MLRHQRFLSRKRLRLWVVRSVETRRVQATYGPTIYLAAFSRSCSLYPTSWLALKGHRGLGYLARYGIREPGIRKGLNLI